MSSLPYNNAERQARDAKDIVELEALLQGTGESAQPVEIEPEGSPEGSVEAIVVEPTIETKKPVHDLEYWKNRALESEKRYNVSKPKYDSNIFKLRQDYNKLQERFIAVSKKHNEQMQSSPKHNPVIDELSREEVVNVLGQETADSIKRNILDTNERVDRQEQRLADKELLEEQQKLKSDVDTRYNKFMTKLTKLVPDQEALNRNPKFLDFLNESDPATGVMRFELLREAEHYGNADRVASFFIEFKGSTRETIKDSIDKRIAPDNSGSDADTHIDQGNKITTAYIDKFFHDVTKGRYKGRHSEQIAIQKSIDDAYMAGNII